MGCMEQTKAVHYFLMGYLTSFKEKIRFVFEYSIETRHGIFVAW